MMYPLGGVEPVAPAPPREDSRHVVMGLLVVVVGLVTVLASFVTWRVWGTDQGPQLAESGWERVGGGLGRGPLAAVLGVTLTCLGAMVAVGYRPRWVRRLGVASSAALMILAVLEWGLGADDVPNAPGLGLWVVFLAGVAGLFPFAAIDPPARSAPDRSD